MDAKLDDDKDSRFEFMAKLCAHMLMHLLIYPLLQHSARESVTKLGRSNL